MPIIRLIGQLIELIEIIGYYWLLLALNVIIFIIIYNLILANIFLQCPYVPYGTLL
jgi:hypothetical protein